MGRVRSYLTREHRECDRLLESVEVAAHTGYWAAAQCDAQSLAAMLAQHFAKEERVWFAHLEDEDDSASAMTAGLREEHSRMLERARLLAMAASWRDPRAVYDTAHSLYCLMVRHNANEERNMFGADGGITDARADRLIARMDAIAESMRAERS